MSSAAVRPRRGRIAAFATAVGVTALTLLAGAGLLPAGSPAPAAAQRREPPAIGLAGSTVEPATTERRVTLHPAATVEGPPGPGSHAEELVVPGTQSGAGTDAADPRTLAAGIAPAYPLPRDSGDGKRVVFDMGDQRVWLVDRDDVVRRTYLVSGSVYDNLRPGTYAVYSRSRHAIGIDDSGTMEYFVRFTRGERAAIGFHTIPVDDGRRVQTRRELGTPLSHGCVRQARPDAKALWDFAPVGTTVVVTA